MKSCTHYEFGELQWLKSENVWGLPVIKNNKCGMIKETPYVEGLPFYSIIFPGYRKFYKDLNNLFSQEFPCLPEFAIKSLSQEFPQTIMDKMRFRINYEKKKSSNIKLKCISNI